MLIGDAVIDSLAGLGIGSLGDSFAAVRAAGFDILVSGGSSKARGGTQPPSMTIAVLAERIADPTR